MTESETERTAMDQDSDQHQRVFLVVVDDSEELKVALRFACQRARHTGGRVALFRSVEPVEFQHWMGVGELMREEARQEAEQLLERVSDHVVALSGTIPVVYIREGSARDELMKLIDEEPSVSILVLAAAPQSDNPGPLVSHLMGKAASRLRIPITIVPGSLSDDEIDALT